MNKSFYERATELIDTSSSIKDRPNSILEKEFGIRSDEVSRRIKSYFGKGMTEIIKDKHLPSREEIEKALILSNDVIEMQSMLNLNKTSLYWKGLLDREFGYSTYSSAKANFISKIKVEPYSPNRDDNIAILVSQRLGDGSIDLKRRVLRIDHSIKQYDYLVFKVALLNKAYPESNKINTIKSRIHPQGHEYASYYSGNFSEKSILKVAEMSNEELIDSLTPLGWLLWYLDDGFNSKSNTFHSYSLGISCNSEELRLLAHKKLLTYGFDFNIQPTMILLQNKVEISKFINSMLKPFEHMIPDCMKYKIELKI